MAKTPFKLAEEFVCPFCVLRVLERYGADQTAVPLLAAAPVRVGAIPSVVRTVCV
jgi:hypothetical protein